MPARPSNAAQAATDDARFDSFARWTELRDRYFEVLRRVALPFFDAFPQRGLAGPRGRSPRAFEYRRAGESAPVRRLKL